MSFEFFIRKKKNIVDFDRTSGGRLHLLAEVGKIPLADATLIEDPNDSDREDEGSSAVIL